MKSLSPGRDDDNGGKKGGRGDGEVTAGRQRGGRDAKAIGYGARAGELIEFIGRNRPEGEMLSMDVDPHRFNSKRGFVRGHLEVDRQLPDGILPPPTRVRRRLKGRKGQRAPNAQLTHQIVDRHHEELKSSSPDSQTLNPFPPRDAFGMPFTVL